MSYILFYEPIEKGDVMAKTNHWENIAQSISFEFVRYGKGVLVDEPWRRSGFTRPYDIIMFIKEGGVFFIYDNGADILEVKKGDCIYIPAGIWRQNIPLNPEEETHVTHFSFNFYIFEHINFLSFFKIPLQFKDQTKNDIIDTIQSLFAVSSDEEKCAVIRSIDIQALEFRLLSTILKDAIVKPNLTDFLGKWDRFDRVFDFISKNYKRNVSSKELASIACLSLSAFHRIFKEITGTTPLLFMRNKRINDARNLLVSTKLLLSEIALQLGYSDQFAFSKSFKQECGQCPSEYRETIWQEFHES